MGHFYLFKNDRPAPAGQMNSYADVQARVQPGPRLEPAAEEEAHLVALAFKFCFLNILSGVRRLTRFYLAKNDHRWVIFIFLKTINAGMGWMARARFSVFRKE